MENQKSFRFWPHGVLIILAGLVVGVGIYGYRFQTQKKSLGHYRDDAAGFSFNYPPKIHALPQADGSVVLAHTVPYTYSDMCDLKDGRTLYEYLDFNAKIQIMSGPIREVINLTQGEVDPNDYLNKDDTFKLSESFVDE